MKKIAVVIAATAAFVSIHNAKASEVYDPILEACQEYVTMGGYPGGVTQDICNANYDLPSPFTIKCLIQAKEGFETKLDADACYMHLEDVQKMNYKDYDMHNFLKNLLNWKEV